MTLDRKDYKSAIPQLEKRIEKLSKTVSTKLKQFDVLSSNLQKEILKREQADLKTNTQMDTITVKMFYQAAVNEPTLDDVNWSETFPDLTADDDGKKIWYKMVTYKGGKVLNQSPVAEVQLMQGVFTFVDSVANTSQGNWTTINGGAIQTGIIKATLTDNYFNLNDGSFQLWSNSTQKGLKWDGSALDITGTLSTSSAVGTTTLGDMVTDIGQNATDIGTKAGKGEANAREQLIYKSAVNGTTTMSNNTTWVTSTSNTQNAWTTRRPEYSSSYPVLFVARQSQTVTQSSGTSCDCTTPVIDETTTIIDGGRIITNSITATQIATGTITANEIAGSTITGAKIAANTIEGTNLKTSSITIGSFSDASSYATTSYADGKANDAAKTATNFITTIGSDGIKVHDSTHSSTNYSQIDSNGLKVFTGGNEAASFGGSTVKLGETSTTAEIQLCNNNGYLLGANYNNSWAGNGKFMTMGTNVSSGIRGSFLTSRAKGDNSATKTTNFADIGAYYDGSSYVSKIVAVGSSNDADISVDSTGGAYIKSKTAGIEIDDSTSDGNFWLSWGNTDMIGLSYYASAGSGEAKKRITFPNTKVITNGSPVNLRINSSGAIGTSSSTRKIKRDIEYVLGEEADPHQLYDTRVAQFRYKEELFEKDDPDKDNIVLGFIAEDMAEDFSLAAVRDKDGNPRDWDERIIVPALTKLVQEQKKMIDSLEERVKILEGKNNE